jgi:TfoX/Sxy family transcriptional regulator of competence genes
MSPMTGGSMPRPSDEAKTAFRAALPDDPAVAVRPMFGNIAAFVHGNMFAGLFGEDLFVRLQEQEQADLIERGGAPFEPMPGRAMMGYVTVPRAWAQDPEAARAWVLRSLELVRGLPQKEPRRRRS